jgi:serine/threonine protein kinase
MASIGRYELLRRLKIGASSEVHLARSSGPGDFEKLLVLKLATQGGAENPDFAEQFLAEARVAARLDHSNIVQVFDVGSEGGQPFLTMEYVEGPSLRQLLDREKKAGRRIPVGIAVNLAAQVCDGLAYAHTLTDRETGVQLGVIHRDVCPDNVLLSKTGIAKLTDFGLARAVDATRATAMRGKASYLAPEVIESSGKYDLRADLFAVGVVLYEMLTGVLPFTGPTQEQLLKAIVSAPLTAPSRHRPEVSAALDAVLVRALSRSPDARYASAGELLAALDAFLATLPAVTAADLAHFIEDEPAEVTGNDTQPQASRTITDLSPVETSPSVETNPSGETISHLRAVQTTADLASQPTITRLPAVLSLSNQPTRRLPTDLLEPSPGDLVETRRLDRPVARPGGTWQLWALGALAFAVALVWGIQYLAPPPPIVPIVEAPLPRPKPIAAEPQMKVTPEAVAPSPAVLLSASVVPSSPAPSPAPGPAAGNSGGSSVRIGRGEGAPATLRLKRAGPGEVRITAKVRGIPVGAKVWVGRKEVGVTPIVVTRIPGIYPVRIAFKGLTYKIELQFSKYQGAEIDAELDPPP